MTDCWKIAFSGDQRQASRRLSLTKVKSGLMLVSLNWLQVKFVTNEFKEIYSLISGMLITKCAFRDRRTKLTYIGVIKI